jgi:hypothetical protein
MDEYAQIYWLDERNASRDHRTQGGGSPAGWRPVPPPVVRPLAPPAPVAATAVPVVRYPAQQVMAQPVMAQPLVMHQPASLFGGLTLGQIIELVAQALAAFQALPAAPVTTSEVEKDVGNLVLYQTALAQHAKRDEQFRTLGSLLSKVIR